MKTGRTELRGQNDSLWWSFKGHPSTILRTWRYVSLERVYRELNLLAQVSSLLTTTELEIVGICEYVLRSHTQAFCQTLAPPNSFSALYHNPSKRIFCSYSMAFSESPRRGMALKLVKGLLTIDIFPEQNYLACSLGKLYRPIFPWSGIQTISVTYRWQVYQGCLREVESFWGMPVD